MKGKKIKCVLVAMSVLAASGTTTYAAENEITDKDLVVDKTTIVSGDQSLLDKGQISQVEEERTGSIQVELTDGKSGTNRNNIKILCEKVADIVDGEYVLTDEYKSSGVDLNAIVNSNDLKNAAEKLVKQKKNVEATRTTDQSGVAIFKNLQVGVYLISAEDSKTYDTVEPALIAIPTWSDTDGNTLYDVTIEPKHTPKPEKGKNDAPQTGLEDNTWKYAGIAGACVLGAAGFGIALTLNKRKK